MVWEELRILVENSLKTSSFEAFRAWGLPWPLQAAHGLSVRLRWAFPSACLRKGRLMDLVCACDGLSPLPVEEKAVSWIGARLGCGWAGLAWAWLDPWRLPWQFKADQGS